MNKYPKLRRYGHESVTEILDRPVTVLEKMDGANFRFTHGKNVENTDDNRLVFGSRNVVYKNEKDTDKNFEHAVEYIRDEVNPDEWIGQVETQADGGDAVTLYGEAMHPHTLDYQWDDVPSVLLFGGHSESYGWFSWSDVETVAERLGLETVPVVDTRVDAETIEQVPKPDESEYRSGFPEGIVLRRGSGDNILRAKYRTEEFLERHSSASKMNQGGEPNETQKLAHKLLRQEPWVEKQIHKYEDRDRKIEMAMMEDLWRDIFDDIIEEEYETILLGNHQLDTQEFRSIIASHTADVLQDYIKRPEESVINER